MPWIVGLSTVASGLLGADAAGDASDASSEASQAAIAENRRQFDLTRNDTAPYRDVGQNSLYELADIFGVSSPYEREVQQLEKDAEKAQRSISMIQMTAQFNGGELTSEQRREIEDLRSTISTGNARLTELRANPPQQTGSRGLYSNLEMDPGYDFRLAEGEKAMQRMQSAGGTRYGGGALKAAMRYGQDYSSNEFSNAVNRRNSELGYLFSLAGFGPQGIATAGQAGANSAANNSNILMQNAANQGNAAMSGASAINNAVQGGIQNYFTQGLLRDYNRAPQSYSPQPATDFNYNYGR